MSRPCRDTIKIILENPKFELNNFLVSSYGDFWKNVVAYLREYDRKSKQKGIIIKHAKYANSKKLLAAMNKVVPSSQSGHYSIDMVKDIDIVFRCYLHPSTPNSWRSQSIRIYFDILRRIQDPLLVHLHLSIAMIVPYFRFATDPERQAFDNDLIKGVEPVVDPLQPPGGQSEGSNDLGDFLNFIKELWSPKTGPPVRRQVAMDLLSQQVIYIVYKTAARELGIQVFGYGFVHPPDLLHERVVDLLQCFSAGEVELAPFFTKKGHLPLFLKVVRHTSTRDDQKRLKIGLDFLTALLTIPDVVNQLFAEGPAILEEVGKVAVAIGTCLLKVADPRSGGLDSLEKFSAQFFTMVIERLSQAEAVPIIHNVLFEQNQEQSRLSTIASMFFSLCHYLVVANPPIAHDILVDILGNSFLVAVVSRYAQYLAVYAFRVLFSLDVEQARQQCSETVRRNQRNKQPAPTGYICEYIDAILEKPHAFAIDHLPSRFPESESHDSAINKVRIPSQPSPEKTVGERVFPFVNAFDCKVESWSRDKRRAAATVTISFAATLVELRDIPPGVQFDRTAAFSLIAYKLFNAVLEQGDSIIRRRGFGVLANLINEVQMKKQLSDKDLSRWYGAIVYEMMEPDPTDRDFGFLQAVTTLRIGFRGSGLLVPLIMSFVEADLFAVGESVMSFVSSLPLFSTGGVLPTAFIERVSKEVNTGDFLRRAVDQLNKQSSLSLRERAINVIRKLRGSRKWPIILPVYSLLIADEITVDEPDSKLLSEVLGYFIEPLQERAREALSSIRSLLMFFDTLKRLIPNELCRFVSDLTTHAIAVTRTDDPQWVAQIVRLTGDLYIHTYELHVTSASYVQFAKFLVSSPSLSFPEEVAQVFANVRELLTVFFGRYPFPDSVFSPSFADPTFPETPVFVSNENIPIRLRLSAGSTQIASQTGSGVFSWSFKQIDDLLYTPQDPKPISIPLSSSVATIPASQELPQQKNFASVFSNIVSTFESLNPCIVGSDKRIGPAVQVIDQQYDTITALPQPTFPILRPPIHANSAPAAALESCGLYQSTKPETIVRLKATEPVGMAIKHLGSKNHRWPCKIGVVFVPEGQTTQNEILSVQFEQTSPHFKEFLTGLGYPVLLESHVGYDGGLDRKKEGNGTTSIYYADFATEVMFHIAPLMPNDPSNPQQIYKKRHIGNDHIHIVWCESGQEYDTGTITSQFNLAHIMIYPLDLGLFRVEIKWRSDLPWFGPLRWSVVVKKTVLPALVRSTAISAMDALFRSQPEFIDAQTDIIQESAKLVAQRPKVGAIQEIMGLTAPTGNP